MIKLNESLWVHTALWLQVPSGHPVLSTLYFNRLEIRLEIILSKFRSSLVVQFLIYNFFPLPYARKHFVIVSELWHWLTAAKTENLLGGMSLKIFWHISIASNATEMSLATRGQPCCLMQCFGKCKLIL